jgi:3-(3-hydroxy-phenyl)propionate hydroxylase
MASNIENRVVIVGAGPVGMVSALALHREGVQVTVLEQEAAPVTDQRAASLHPPTLEMLGRLNVTQAIIQRGLVAPVYKFHDRLSGKVVAEFDLTCLKDELEYPFVLQYEQYKLTRDISQQYANESDFDVRFSRRVTSATQHADKVEVTAEGPDGSERFECAYVIGADGGRSFVRKSQDIAFEGFTYPERFIKIATNFDFRKVHPEYAFRNYFSDPDEWCNLFKVRGESPEGLWRVIFPTPEDESEDEALRPQNVERRLQKFFPKDGSYYVEYVNIYNVSQRVAATFRRGRVLLIGDSAHVNNPIGGMGMNGGIHDAINLAEKLGRVIRRETDESILDLYSRQRRKAAIDYVQAQTIRNKKMLEERDLTVRQQHLQELQRAADDPKDARAFMLRASLVESLQAAKAA